MYTSDKKTTGSVPRNIHIFKMIGGQVTDGPFEILNLSNFNDNYTNIDYDDWMETLTATEKEEQLRVEKYCSTLAIKKRLSMCLDFCSYDNIYISSFFYNI